MIEGAGDGEIIMDYPSTPDMIIEVLVQGKRRWCAAVFEEEGRYQKPQNVGGLESLDKIGKHTLCWIIQKEYSLYTVN